MWRVRHAAVRGGWADRATSADGGLVEALGGVQAFSSEQRPDLAETSSDTCLCRAERDRFLPRDLIGSKAVERREDKGTPLLGRKQGEGRPDPSRSVGSLCLVAGVRLIARDAEIDDVVRVNGDGAPHAQRVDGKVAGDGEDPRRDRSPAGVVDRRVAPRPHQGLL